MVTKKDKELLITFIKKHIPDCKIYLFGSRSRKTNSVGSDIDLAIESGQVISRHDIADVLEEIENSNIPFFVDLVDMKQINDNFKTEIMKDRILWSE